VAAWDKLDRGMRIAAVSCHIGVYEPMICSIKKCEDKIRQSDNISAPLRVKITVQDTVNSSLKRYGSKMTHRKIVSHWCCNDGKMPVKGRLLLKNYIKTSLDTTLLIITFLWPT